MASVFERAKEIIGQAKEFEVGEWELTARRGKTSSFRLQRYDQNGKNLPPLSEDVEFPSEIMTPSVRYALECWYMITMGGLYAPSNLQTLIRSVQVKDTTPSERAKQPYTSLRDLLKNVPLNGNNAYSDLFEQASGFSTGTTLEILWNRYGTALARKEGNTFRGQGASYTTILDQLVVSAGSPEKSLVAATAFIRLWNTLRYGVTRLAFSLMAERRELWLPSPMPTLDPREKYATDHSKHVEVLLQDGQKRAPVLFQKLMRNIVRDANTLLLPVNAVLTEDDTSKLSLEMLQELASGLHFIYLHKLNVKELKKIRTVITHEGKQIALEFPGYTPSEGMDQARLIIDATQELGAHYSALFDNATTINLHTHVSDELGRRQRANIQKQKMPSACPFSRLIGRVYEEDNH